MGATADKIAKAILAHERSGVIDLSRYRAAKAAVEGAQLGDDRLRELLAKGYDPAHASARRLHICAELRIVPGRTVELQKGASKIC